MPPHLRDHAVLPEDPQLVPFVVQLLLEARVFARVGLHLRLRAVQHLRLVAKFGLEHRVVPRQGLQILAQALGFKLVTLLKEKTWRESFCPFPLMIFSSTFPSLLPPPRVRSYLFPVQGVLQVGDLGLELLDARAQFEVDLLVAVDGVGDGVHVGRQRLELLFFVAKVVLVGFVHGAHVVDHLV
jgi:hypothetical protein